MVRSSLIATCLVLVLAPSAHAGSASSSPTARAAWSPARAARRKLPRRVACAGEGLIALCGDGQDRIEDPDADTEPDVHARWMLALAA